MSDSGEAVARACRKPGCDRGERPDSTFARHDNIAGVQESGAQNTLAAASRSTAIAPAGRLFLPRSHGSLVADEWGGGLHLMPQILSVIIRANNVDDHAETERQKQSFADFRHDLCSLGYPPVVGKRAFCLIDNPVGASR